MAHNPEIVSQYVANEVAQGKLRQLDSTEAVTVHKSPTGIIPKASKQGKFQLIVNLSSPPQFSMNDKIPHDLCSLEYASMDQAVSMVASMGVGP